jgi:hypothetical protein
MTRHVRPANKRAAAGRTARFDRPEGQYSGEADKTRLRTLAGQLYDISQEEIEVARRRQKEAKIKPMCHNFRVMRLEVDQALGKLWASGQKGRELYVMLGKGLATISEQDLLSLCAYNRQTMRLLTPRLVQGWSWVDTENELIKLADEEMERLKQEKRK